MSGLVHLPLRFYLDAKARIICVDEDNALLYWFRWMSVRCYEQHAPHVQLPITM